MSSKISCDICADLYPLVNDGIASEDSRLSVAEHISTCEKCAVLYDKEDNATSEKVSMDEKRIGRKIKNKLVYVGFLLIVVGILLGVSLSMGEFMFYNIVIMPIIGGVGYFTFKNKSYLVIIAVFICVYARSVYDTLGYAFQGEFINAFVPPLWWAMIYTGLSVLGMLIAFLLRFGFKKEIR